MEGFKIWKFIQSCATRVGGDVFWWNFYLYMFLELVILSSFLARKEDYVGVIKVNFSETFGGNCVLGILISINFLN